MSETTQEPASKCRVGQFRRKPAVGYHGRRHCCIVGCDTMKINKVKSKFECYGFPYYPWEEERRQKWISLVKRTNPDGTPWQPSKLSFMCSAHFIGNRKSDHPQHPSYLPTIFPPAYNEPPPSPNRIDRFKLRSSTQHSSRATKTTAKSSNRPITTQTATTTTIAPPNVPSETVTSTEPARCKGLSRLRRSGPKNRVTTSRRNETSPKSHTIATQTTKIMIPVSSRTFVDRSSQTDCTEKPSTCDRETSAVDLSRIGVQNFLQCRGFHAFKSVTNDTDMRDLAGISLAKFSQLLQQLPKKKPNAKLSNEDRLLVFLMRLNKGLSFATLRLLFGVERSTACLVYKNILSQLSDDSLKLAKSDKNAGQSREKKMEANRKRTVDVIDNQTNLNLDFRSWYSLD